MKTNCVKLFLLLSVLLAVSSGISGASAVLPDFAGWGSEKGSHSATHDNKVTIITFTVYTNIDWAVLERQMVRVFNDENINPWLAFYSKEVGEKLPDGGINTEKEDWSVFEKINGKWVFVKNFPPGTSNLSKSFADFIADRYKLVF